MPEGMHSVRFGIANKEGAEGFSARNLERPGRNAVVARRSATWSERILPRPPLYASSRSLSTTDHNFSAKSSSPVRATPDTA